jgi:hypothetical protein
VCRPIGCGNRGLDGVFLVDSFGYLVDANGKDVDYLPAMLQNVFLEKGLVFMAVCFPGCKLEGGSNFPNFTGLLNFVPAGLDLGVAIICGNDFYSGGKIVPFRQVWASAAPEFASKFSAHVRRPLGVVGASSEVSQ